MFSGSHTCTSQSGPTGFVFAGRPSAVRSLPQRANAQALSSIRRFGGDRVKRRCPAWSRPRSTTAVSRMHRLRSQPSIISAFADQILDSFAAEREPPPQLANVCDRFRSCHGTKAAKAVSTTFAGAVPGRRASAACSNSCAYSVRMTVMSLAWRVLAAADLAERGHTTRTGTSRMLP